MRFVMLTASYGLSTRETSGGERGFFMTNYQLVMI